MSFYLYHRETSQRPWTMTDEGDGERSPRLMGYADSLEELEAEVSRRFATGFVACYPAGGELVVLDGRFDADGASVCVVWPIDALRRLRLEPGISPLRSWMAEVAPRIGKGGHRGGLGQQEAARAFLELWSRVQEQAPELAEQERAWLIGAVRTSPALHEALVGLVRWGLLDDYAEVQAAAAQAPGVEAAFWERLDAWTAAQFREQLDLVEALRALGCDLERRDG